MSVLPAASAAREGWSIAAIRNDLKVLARLAGPVIVSRLGIMTMGLTDALVVGRFSALQLSYHALGWAPTGVVLTVVLGLLTGVPVMTSRVIGEGRRDLTGAVLRRGLVYGLWIGGGGSVVLMLLGPPFLRAAGLGKDLADGATPVLLTFSLSMIPYVLATVLSMWLEAISKPTPAMVMMWGANVVNLVIDLVVVPGRLGAPALGAVGGACATLGARLFLMAALAIYILRMPEARALGVFDKPARDRPSEIDQRKVGYGAGLSNLFEVAAFSGMNIVAGWVSALTIAAYAISLNVLALVFMIPLGLSTAAGVMVGGAYGARDRTGTNRAAVVGYVLAALFGVVVTLIVWPSARLIVAGYTHDPAVIAMATPALLLSCLFLIPDALQVVVAQTLRSRGDVWVPSLSHFISYAVIMGPLAWWLALPMHMGLNGIIWGAIIATLVSAGLLLGRFAMLARRPLA